MPDLVVDLIGDWMRAQVRRVEHRVFVAAPYIHLRALEYIFDGVNSWAGITRTVVTNWVPQSILQGSLDSELFEYCHFNSISLKSLAGLHAKILLVDNSVIITGSSNFTLPGLGLGFGNPNHEVVSSKRPTISDIEAVTNLLVLAQEVSWKEYIETVKLLRKAKGPVEVYDPSYRENFVEASLFHVPNYGSIDEAWIAYCANGKASFEFLGRRVPGELEHDVFVRCVSRVFVHTPLVRMIDERLARGPLYFGQAKELLRSVTNYAGFLRELTGSLQTLFCWFQDVEPKRYSVDEPHYSQRLRLASNGRGDFDLGGRQE